MNQSPTYSTAVAVPAVQAIARRTLREGAHVVTDLAVGVVGFSVVIAALATGASLAITLVGIPILAGTLLLARHAAGIERSRARALLGIELAAPPARARAASFAGRVVDPLRDRAAWRATSYFLLMFPAGVLTFSAAVAWVGSGLVMFTLPVWAWALPHGGPQVGDAYWSSPGQLAASSVAGLLMIAATPFVIRAITRVDRALLRLIDAR